MIKTLGSTACRKLCFASEADSEASSEADSPLFLFARHITHYHLGLCETVIFQIKCKLILRSADNL